MTLFPSVPSALLFLAASVLTVWGSNAKTGHVLSFFGALAGMLAVLLALVDGANLIRCLLYILILLLLSRGRGEGAEK